MGDLDVQHADQAIKRYHANYNQGGGVTTKRTWGDVPGNAINATNQTY